MIERFNKTEFLVGFFAVSLLWLKLGIWIGLCLSLLTGILWWCGGSFEKIIRRLGVPLVSFLVTSLTLGFHWWYVAMLPVGFAVLSLGDGYPDFSTGDAGSWLGSKVYKLGLTDYWGGLLVKLTVVLLFQLSLLPVLLVR